MDVLVVGCGRVGADLAVRLSESGHTVVVLDHQVSAQENLPHDFRGQFFEGDGLNQDTLRRIGIEECDAFAAVTSSDVANAVLSHIASSIYHIPRVIARNFDPRYRSLFDVFGIHVVCAATWGAQRMEEMLYHKEIRTLFSAGNGEVDIYEIAVPEQWNDRRLGNLISVSGVAIIALTRSGRAIIPSLEEMLHTGDILHISATCAGIEAVRTNLHQQEQEG